MQQLGGSQKQAYASLVNLLARHGREEERVGIWHII